MAGNGILALGAAELSALLIVLCVVVIPIAAIAFARSGRGYSEIGRGRFAVDFDQSPETERDDEIRQLVEAKAYRQSRRGEQPLDVENEVARLLGGDEGEPETGQEPPAGPEPPAGQAPPAGPETPPADPEAAQIRAEIRQVVVAKNESRARRGEAPLDVEAEIDRMLAEFGQAGR